MSYDYCQSWNEKEKRCGKGLKKCYLSHLDENGNCDGWVFDEPDLKIYETGDEYEEGED